MSLSLLPPCWREQEPWWQFAIPETSSISTPLRSMGWVRGSLSWAGVLERKSEKELGEFP
jgi:hypothetical protein